MPKLVIMAKEPVIGRVKTRLAQQVGAVQATCFYRHTLAAVASRLGASPRWQLWLAVSPDPRTDGWTWPTARRRGQGGGDLGQRMRRILHWSCVGPLGDRAGGARRRAGSMGAGPVVIVGSDIPRITRAHIAAAFRRLGDSNVVFGPAADGGYWLVGWRGRRPVPDLFSGVRWSSADALADTLANCDGLSVGFVATLDDVDDGRALSEARGWCGRRVLPAASG